MATLHNSTLDQAPATVGGFELNLGNFEGPFDLLLNLIAKHELDITEVALARVTDEFLAFLRTLDQAEEIERASEFLVVAATLLDLKIASLLPKGEVVDAEELALLEARDLLFAKLLQYRAFKEVSTWFATALGIEAQRIARDVAIEERFRQAKPKLVWTLDPAAFAAIAQDAFAPREVPGVGLVHLHAPRVSVHEQALTVVARLREKGRLSFGQLIAGEADKAVVIARFLAVLELYRLLAVSFEQSEPLAELQLVWRANDFDEKLLTNLGADYDN